MPPEPAPQVACEPARRRDRRPPARSPRVAASGAPAVPAVVAAALGLVAFGATAWAASSPGAPSPWSVTAAAAVAAPGPAPQDGSTTALTDGAELASAVVTPPSSAALPRAAEVWTASVAAATGIPVPAAQAYGDAALALGVEQPACRVGWTTLAGIGAIESGHGTHGGSALSADGRAEPPIIGPALDGQQFAAIPATAQSAAWTGDPVWDHAVGPLQFIGPTWARWAADGDGDGVTDPQDIDDAALAAARYLCAGGQDLGTAAGWHAAVYSYNHSEQYVADVLVRANAYAAAAAAVG